MKKKINIIMRLVLKIIIIILPILLLSCHNKVYIETVNTAMTENIENTNYISTKSELDKGINTEYGKIMQLEIEKEYRFDNNDTMIVKYNDTPDEYHVAVDKVFILYFNSNIKVIAPANKYIYYIKSKSGLYKDYNRYYLICFDNCKYLIISSCLWDCDDTDIYKITNQSIEQVETFTGTTSYYNGNTFSISITKYMHDGSLISNYEINEDGIKLIQPYTISGLEDIEIIKELPAYIYNKEKGSYDDFNAYEYKNIIPGQKITFTNTDAHSIVWFTIDNENIGYFKITDDMLKDGIDLWLNGHYFWEYTKEGLPPYLS